MSIYNTNRLRTKKVVSLFPGIHLRKLQRVMNTSFNTTRYHVHNLERDGEIVCSKEGGLERLYPRGMDERGKKLNAIMLDKASRTILEALLSSGSLSNGALSASTRLPKSTVSERVDTMRKAEMVRRVTSIDGSVTYALSNREEAAVILAAFKKNLVASAADSFIDLWDI